MRWRQQIHRRIALADWSFAMGIAAAVFAAFTILLLILATGLGSNERSALFVTIGVLWGIGVLVALLSLAAQLALWR